MGRNASTVVRELRRNGSPGSHYEAPAAQRRPRGANRGRIVGRVGIEHRPADVAMRQQAGHWEGDTVVGRPGEAVLVTYVERKSRFVVAFKLPSRHAVPLRQATVRHLGRKIPAHLRSTLTFDNGKEFADFKSMERGLGASAYFADPHSPWQRGSNENTNGLIRHFLPKSTNLTHVSRREINRIVGWLNNRPRKCLDWRTPAEVMALEHF